MQNTSKILIGAAIAVAVSIGLLFTLPGYVSVFEMDDRAYVAESVQQTIDSFNGTLNSVKLTSGPYYSFVLDDKLDKILLHPREELENTTPVGLSNANIPISEMNHMLDKSGAVWIHYEFYNPDTGNVDPKTTYLVKHEGYVFGAGFYSP